jgi:outer membrane protein TolC
MTGRERGAAALVTLASVLIGATGRVEAQPLTEERAMARALEANPTLRAALLDLRASEEALRAAEAEHLPTLRVGVDGGHNESFSSTLEGVTPNSSDRVGLGLGVSYGAPWGTEVSLDVNGRWQQREVNRDPSTTDNLTIAPTYGLDATVEVRQPLLRGAGRDVGEAGIRSARLSRTAEEHTRDRAASELLRDVLHAYWELWYARAALEVQLEAREMALQQLAEAEARVSQLGTLARADALRFASELASIEVALAEAEATRLTRAIELGRLLGLGPDQGRDLDVVPEGPSAVEAASSNEVVELAREASSELLELAAQAEATRDGLRAARDATLPRFDLTGSLALGALWDDESIGTGDLPGDRPAISGLAGLELELPLGNARARAELAAAGHRAESADLRLVARRQAIEAEASSLVAELDTAIRRAELSQRSMEIAAQLAEAERGRLRLGTTTSFQVLEAQESQRENELRHLRALVDRAAAARSIHHLTGELLRRYADLVGER